jgi:hypothetical protein
LAKLRYDIDSFFIETMQPQWEVVQEQFAMRQPDVVLCETGFTAAVPIIMSGADRPTVSRQHLMLCASGGAGVLRILIMDADT